MIKTKKLFLLLAMLLMSIGASAQSQLKGDVNNDGKVDEADITAVIEIMKNGGGVTDSNDVNKDGKVDVADIVAIIGIIKNGGGSSGETKYYWYAGPDMLTSATVPGSGTVYPMTTTSDSQTGWHVIEGEPTSIETGDLANPEKINWVLAIPTKFGLNHISNGVLDITSGYDVSTVTTADGVEYIVFKQLRATKRIDVTFVKGSTSGEVFDPNSYYIYIGLNRPTSDTDIAADLASNNTPLIEGMASMGWRRIGPDISIYNSSNPAYNGGGYKSTVCLDKNFNNVTCYIAIPVGMGIFDIFSEDTSWTLDQANITIKGHQYNVYKTVLEGEFGEIIYYKGGSSSGETKYYWYAGPDMLTSATVPGVNEGNDCGYGWHVIEGNPTSIETGELGTSDCQKINWVLAIPTKFGLNHISNGVLDITSGYDVSTVTTADGVEYIVFKQISASKKTDRIFVKGSSSETKYYWYAGPDMLTSATVPGSGTVYPMTTTADSQIGWHIIEGEPTSFETGDLYNPTRINWVLAIPTKLGLNNLSNGVDIVTDAYDVTTVTCADGVEYKVFRQVEDSKRIYLIFVK